MLIIGNKINNFTAKIEDGSTIELAQFKGKKKIIYFYPKDNTPACTANACDFRDNYQSLVAKGFEVLGVSIQGESSHKKFIAKYDLPFHLIVDEDLTLHNQFGVWGKKAMYGKEYMGTLRTTFILDENDTLLHIITKVDTKNASKQILDLMGLK
jgi:peroxiredoxin Q/BCP